MIAKKNCNNKFRKKTEVKRRKNEKNRNFIKILYPKMNEGNLLRIMPVFGDEKKAPKFMKKILVSLP